MDLKGESVRSTPRSFKPRVSVSAHTEWFYKWFASIGISRVWISRTRRGELRKRHVETWRLLLFILLRLNLILKTGFLMYLLFSPQENGEYLDFLTCLGIGIWIVLAGVAVYSDYYFAQIYPTFEVFCAFWNVQSDIYERLSDENKEKYKNELNRSAKVRTTFHTCASLNAMFGLAAQYLMEPKGLMFTGSLIENDSTLVLFLCALHEEIFLVSVWYQAVSIILIPVLVSREFTVTLRFLEKELMRLQKESSVIIVAPSPGDDPEKKGPLTYKKIVKEVCEDDRYTINSILEDYQQLEIIADRLEDISSFWLLITQIIYFAQITSDVFVGIQLMRVGDTLSVAFYATDCTAGMSYWFFSLYSMGRLDEAMQDFQYALISYFRCDDLKRRLHLRMIKAFREIRVYLGPSPVKKETAAEVIFDLFNYYILAAMW